MELEADAEDDEEEAAADAAEEDDDDAASSSSASSWCTRWRRWLIARAMRCSMEAVALPRYRFRRFSFGADAARFRRLPVEAEAAVEGWRTTSASSSSLESVVKSTTLEADIRRREE